MGKYLNSYTAGYKLKVIEYALEHGKRAAGRKFDVDEKCVRRWCAQKEALRNTNSNKRAFRGKQCKFPDLEEELLRYVTEVRNDGLALTTDMLCVPCRLYLGGSYLRGARCRRTLCPEFLKSPGYLTAWMALKMTACGVTVLRSTPSRTPSLRTRRVTTIEHVCRKKCRILQ